MSSVVPIAVIQPLRIAMFSIHSSPLGPLGTRNNGGMSVYVSELAKWLGCRGHRVDIFTYTRAKTTTVMLHPNVRLIHLAPPGGREIPKEQLPRQLNTVFEAIENHRQNEGLVYDLIHSHYWLSGVVGTMAQARWQCPHMTMFHTLGMAKNKTASGENEPDSRIAHERWLAKAADVIVVPALREQNNLIELYRTDPQKIRIIPCGVNLERFRPMDRAASRSRLGIPADADVVLFVGRFAPLKGIDALLGALADLKTTMPRLRLLLVGGDGTRSRSSLDLARMAQDLDIQDRVTFAGRVDQARLPDYYNACDLLAVPSHYESFGLVLLEALACGIPVVTTRVGAAETIIQPGKNGIIVDASAGASIARGIARILRTPRLKCWSPAQVRGTVTRYGWDRIAAAVMEIYSELIKSASNAPSPVLAAAGNTLPN